MQIGGVVAGTEVAIENGNRWIEDIRTNDYVWAKNPSSGEVALKRVVRTFVNQTNELVHVQINGEIITCTTEHPFYVQGMGWVAAKDLKSNDKLELQSGEDAFVDEVRCERLCKPILVYNFEVEDFHTYFVGGYCVLVHNACDRGVGGKGWENDATWKKNVKTVQAGGSIIELDGGVPTKLQGVKLIQQAQGHVLRIEGGHLPPNPHTYPHINYLTLQGIRSALHILSLE